MTQKRPRVGEYMTSAVDIVAAGDTVGAVADQLANLGHHDGFPVCEDGELVGLVTARQLLLNDNAATIREIMSTEVPVADPDMKIKNAARVMLREGTSDLPVVTDSELVGIITHADILRSQIERTTPSKVDKLVSTLEQVHDVTPTVEREEVPLAALIPTQPSVYEDELRGRQYELENDLAEPLVVIESDGELLLADGHHRAVAASKVGRTGIEAYVIQVGDIEVGMRETARNQHLNTVGDIRINDSEEHPLIETISRLRDN